MTPNRPIINLDAKRIVLQTYNSTAQALANQAAKFGANRSIIIAPGQGPGAILARTLSNYWKKQHNTVLSQLSYKPETGHSKSIAALLEIDQAQARKKQLEKKLWRKVNMTPRRRQDIDAFFLIANSQEARSFVPLLKYYYAENIPVLVALLDDPNPKSISKDLDNAWIYGSPWMGNMSKSWLHNASQLLGKRPQNLSLTHFALGYDALSLALDWDKLKYFPSLKLPAATGILSANSHAQLKRHGVWSRATKQGLISLEPID